MNILALDLANFASSLALMKDGKVVYAAHQAEFRGQDIELIPKLKSLLEKHGLRFQDLDCLVTTTGPGSFTGIRVALATVQGLSLAADIPALGLPTFEVVRKTYSLQTSQEILVLLESLRLEVYGQLYDVTGKAKGPAFSLAPAQIAQRPDLKQALCIGNGALHMAAFGLDVDPFMPQASDLAALTATIQTETFLDYPCTPVYIRDADTTKPAAFHA
jgi:tRNA threonylcarbamoyladenosine biosynthesis protein TsaB